MIYYENECEEPIDKDFDDVTLADQLLEATLDYLKCEYECECNLLITSLEVIHELNNETRGIDRPTDVLSYPMIDFKTPCDYSCIDEDDCTLFNPQTGAIMLGDIVICRDKVLSQAEEYGHTNKREFSFLIVHSLLHLFGYDHMNDDERIEMENMQSNILNKLNITR